MGEEVEKHILRKYELLQKLGKGAYGIVWKAIDKNTRQVVALKKCFDAFRNATDAQRTFREVMYLQELNGHANIIRLLNVIKADNDRDIYLVFDFMETDLHAVIRANILEEIHKKYIIYQLLKSLKYMHTAELLHRDIKPSNLLLNSDCHTKLCDFGLCRSVSEMGGPNPRILDVTGPPTSEDVESIKSPFANTMLESLPTPKLRPLEELFPKASPEALDLIRQCFWFDPSKRITCDDALKHPYVAQFHNEKDEPSAPGALQIVVDDNTKYSAADYRDRLYREIIKKKKESTPRGRTRRMVSPPAALAIACSSFLLHAHAQRLVPGWQRHPQVGVTEPDANTDGGEQLPRDLRASAAAPVDDLVRELPGLDPSVNLTHHAGHIALRSGERNRIFYWHFPAATAPESAPLVVWFNGGPGCSSMQGMFLGISPFKLVNATTIEINKHSWHHSANLLFVDQPVGTGMSSTRGNSFRTAEEKVAGDFYDFLSQFLLRHMEYLSVDPGSNKQVSREVFLFGESHAGRYIPQFATHILAQNKVPFKDADITIRVGGVGIGNGWVHPPIQYEYSEYAHGMGLLTFGQVRSLKAAYGECANALLAGKFNTPQCFANMNAILQSVRSSDGMSLNYYDVREYVHSVRSYPKEQNRIVEYLNQPSVREALHADEERALRFEVCSDPVYKALADFDGVSTLADVQAMLRSGVRVLFYNGQWDMMCNHFGTEKLLLHLDWNGSSEYQAATKYTWATSGRKAPAGFAQQGGNLTYLVIANGGHMVPYDVPDVAADMVHKFINGVAFTDSAQQVANAQTNVSNLESVQCVAETSTDSPDSFAAAVQQLGVPWVWVAVLISVVSSVLAVAVTVLFLRNRQPKQRTGAHSRIGQESDDDDDDDEDAGDAAVLSTREQRSGGRRRVEDLDDEDVVEMTSASPSQ
ncbi:hypothetical protein PybrP1_002607, partial [[Pythium] brassicae (nom. inval.)]